MARRPDRPNREWEEAWALVLFARLLLSWPHGIPKVQQFLRDGRYEVSLHAQQERLEENLDLAKIETAIIEHGEILDDYPNDPRGESCLVLGFVGSRPIHGVMGWETLKGEAQRMLRLITVYTPTAPKWMDPRTRGGRT
jgi:hypothetical protein